MRDLIDARPLATGHHVIVLGNVAGQVMETQAPGTIVAH
jgi:hypothetical protein